MDLYKVCLTYSLCLVLVVFTCKEMELANAKDGLGVVQRSGVEKPRLVPSRRLLHHFDDVPGQLLCQHLSNRYVCDLLCQSMLVRVPPILALEIDNGSYFLEAK